MKTQPKKLFYARDQLFMTNQSFSSREEALQYLEAHGNQGFIETFELQGDYYKFQEKELVGKSNETKFGEIMPDRVHKSRVDIILSGK